MDISDAGPRLDALWTEVDNNLCGVLHGCSDASAVAACFVRVGWRSRSSSWDGYEVETSWCQVEIDPVDGSDVLLSGVVDPARLDELGRILAAFELACTLELSDESHTSVREIRG
ncbi:hypothetical protein ACWGIN_09945 [Streptomyces sp. NPDC054861]